VEWRELAGCWTLVPSQPLAVVHFLGGAFVAAAPQLTYRWLLEQLAAAGYAIVATPFSNASLDHGQLARDALNRFETAFARLQATPPFAGRSLPVYGLGHSMGCKLHLLIGCLNAVTRAGNIFMAYNNYPARRAIPLLDRLDLAPVTAFEFVPSPAETLEVARADYAIRRTLLVRFRNDEIDQTLQLLPVLKARPDSLASAVVLPGNHTTPCSQDFDWQTGDTFTPVDGIAQWVKQEFSRDLKRLQQELLRWLDPAGAL